MAGLHAWQLIGDWSVTGYHIGPSAPHANAGAPPVQRGRPMGQFCQPNRTPDGQETAWGTIDPQDLYGPEGWCMAAEPKHQCPCTGDGAFFPVPACGFAILLAACWHSLWYCCVGCAALAVWLRRTLLHSVSGVRVFKCWTTHSLL